MASGNQGRSKKSMHKLSLKRNTSNQSDNSVVTLEYSRKDGGEEKVICFCGDDRELGEMACCELCAGWFHFSCMRFRENVDLLENKDFVCCFCLASRTLSLIREVESLRKEVKELREKRSTEENASPPSKKSEHAPKKQNHRLPERENEASYSTISQRCPKLEKVASTMKEQERRIELHDRQLRNKNVVVYGLDEEDSHGPLGQFKSILSNKLKIESQQVSIIEAFRLGKKRDSTIRPLLVKLNDAHCKEDIMNKCHMLRGSGIFISNDYTKLQRQNRKKIGGEDERSKGGRIWQYFYHSSWCFDGGRK